MGPRLAAIVLCVAMPCWAQNPAPSPQPAARAASAVQRSTDTVPQRGGEPVVKRIVSEDESVRIEELRVRGQTQRIVVRSKLPGVPSYEIGTAADGRDVTQDRRTEGRSLWQLLTF
jgi:hypothetical protein